MVRKDIISRKLNQLEENISILKKLRKYTKTEFLSEPERYGSAERFLQLAIEIIADIGSHIISDNKYGEVDTYADIARILCKKKHITTKQRERWISMVGFRNILVHGYTKIDRSVVFSVLQNNLKDLESLSKQFAKLL